MNSKTQARFDILTYAAARHLPRIAIGAGDKLFLKGETADAMYVVVSGTIEVLMFGRILERVGRGGIVGEMALIDGDARCAAALTECDTEVIAIARDTFLDMVREEPKLALAVLHVMAQRLRAATKAAASARHDCDHMEKS